MAENKRSKEDILKAIERLEKNPGDRLTFLTDIGAIGVGAVGAGAAAVAFGGTTASILFGLVTLPVAAPVTVVAGAVLLGGVALLGAKRFLMDGTYQDGKREEMLRQLRDLLREIEEKERKSSTTEKDKTQFYSFLKEPLKRDLITSEDAQKIIELVETGKMSISDAYKAVREVLSEARGLPPSNTK
ncbi:MAG: hypothetical protein KME23_14695 [Goleter apudmare HA4340-LM2]|jgi:hypothetical protein|nr:hypothetical protein [Goleter apudmare HA4340-LM2]